MGKQVKTPRFYVDIPTFLHATGDLHWDGNKGGAELLYMNCANPVTSTPDTQEQNTLFLIGDDSDDPKTSFPVNFCALLNHNLASDSHIPKLIGYNKFDDTYQVLNKEGTFLNNVLNMPNLLTIPPYNGTSIWTCGADSNGINDYWSSFQIRYDIEYEAGASTYIDTYKHQLGSMVVGKYWDAPNSPDLNLTMSRRFDGIKRQKTIGGKTLANIYYDGPTEWTMYHPDDGTYKYPPFELDLSLSVEDDLEGSNVFHSWRAKSGLGRKGLRSWKLTFSYISEDDMWMAYESSSIAPFSDGDSGYDVTTDTDVPTDDGNSVASLTNPNPMLSDDSFNFVWNCTLGGTLPFIFQPDNTNNNPDQFSICTFRGNSLSVKQVAFNTYSLSVTIDEVA